MAMIEICDHCGERIGPNRLDVFKSRLLLDGIYPIELVPVVDPGAGVALCSDCFRSKVKGGDYNIVSKNADDTGCPKRRPECMAAEHACDDCFAPQGSSPPCDDNYCPHGLLESKGFAGEDPDLMEEGDR